MATLERSDVAAAEPITVRRTRPKPRSLGQRDRWLFGALLAPGVILSVVLIFMPVVYAVQLSLYHLETFLDEPQFVGLANYAKMLADERFWHAFVNGLIYAVSTVVLQVVLGIFMATLLHQEFRSRNWLRGAMMAPYVLPTVVVTLIWKWILDMNHGVATWYLEWLGLGRVPWFESPVAAMLSTIGVSVWHWTPFVTITFLAALQTVSDDLYDAAAVDGANAWQRLCYITLPVLKPVLVVIIVLRGIFMFNKFDIIWLLTGGGPVGATEHLPTLAYQKTFKMFDIGGGAAVATAIFVFLSLLVWLYFKLFPLEERA